eukprot:496786_1
MANIGSQFMDDMNVNNSEPDDNDIIIDDIPQCNSDMLQNNNKENENNINFAMDTNTNSLYHGEYAKGLTDNLFDLLDMSIRKWLEDPSIWLECFKDSMENNQSKILHFYPILLNELNQKIKNHYLSQFDNINANKHLAFLQTKLMFTMY